MKLAQALNERADIQRRIAQLRSRLINNSKRQEGEKTAEDPGDLLNELTACTQRLEELMARINKTNSCVLYGDKTITELIAHKDTLSLKLGIYRDFLNNASAVVNRMTKTEIKILPSVDVKELQKQIDDMSKEYRETDTKIQELNWTTELL
ncbi:DIP1984 family protein [Ruminococcus sp. FC2018]|uniref:DIP1984 family protein n=1 Tax=Ruminococcus sp. FC2018 TaxID=1410617 RepID=UPI00049052EA|nr:DIP1984 family protein [Ruminococcus sp. FC2018]